MRLIDADALKGKIEKRTFINDMFRFLIDQEPTVGHVKHRHWMPHKMRDGTPMEKCDACGGLSQMMFDYCPNCGAWMYVRRG